MEVTATLQDGRVVTGWRAVLIVLPHVPVILVYLLAALVQIAGDWLISRVVKDWPVPWKAPH